MPLAIGLDLGTTTITAVALDPETRSLAGCATAANRADVTSPEGRRRGHSEWDAKQIARVACECLAALTARLPARDDFIGLGITGQQHGTVLLDAAHAPCSPLINWQDRRTEEPHPGGAGSWVDAARSLVGDEAWKVAGCRLSAGYAAVTLFWLRAQGLLPEGVKACFLMDYLGSFLTGKAPVTEATCAASAGVIDLRTGDWSEELLKRLGLPRHLFPPVRPAGTRCGTLTPEAAWATGLPEGLPVFVGIGDNQASFLGSVANREHGVLVNVGTGGQVAQWSPSASPTPTIEARPFPGGGFLHVSAGLAGGAAYAALEQFIRQIGTEVFGLSDPPGVYEALNRLAAAAPPGCGGITCEPFFAGTRAEPARRASWANLSLSSFTPGHLARSLLEGVARTLAGSRTAIERQTGRAASVLVGAGNGIRNNPLLAELIADAFGLPMHVPAHREEAACGAALQALYS